MAGQPGFFDVDERYAGLSAAGDPVARLATVIDFELVRAELDTALERSDRARGGRPSYDAVLMFKALGPADALHAVRRPDRVPDPGPALVHAVSGPGARGCHRSGPQPDRSKTIWLVREQLTRAGAVARLFARFDVVLRESGCLAMGGQIVDATIVQARRPRLGKDEKATVKGGGVPEGWSQAKRAQMDTEARRTLKRGRRRPARERHEQVQSALVIPAFGYT